MIRFVKPLFNLINDKYLFILLVLIDLIWVYFYLYPGSIINVYLLRDIERSYSITNGAFPWVGSDTTAGGYTGGSTFYFLIWPAVWISNANVKFVIIYSLILRTLSQIFSSIYLKKYFNISHCFSYLLLSSLLFCRSYFVWFTNATYVFILVPIILYLFYRFLILKPGNNDATKAFLLSFLVGCSSHVHITMWYLMFIFLIIVFNRYRNNRAEFLKILTMIFIAAVATQSSYLFLYFIDQSNGLAAKAIFYYNIEDFEFFKIQQQFIVNDLYNIRINQHTLEFIIIFLISIFVTINEFFLKPKKISSVYMRYISLFLSLACLITTPFLARVYAQRYLMVLCFTVVFIFLISSRNFFKRSKIFNTLAFVVLVFFYAYSRTIVSQKPDIKDFKNRPIFIDLRSAEIICNYFNANKISFNSFINNTFEIFPAVTEDSFWNAKFCFNTIDSDNSVSHNKRYFIVHSKLYDKTTNSLIAQVILPNEIKDAFQSSPLLIEAKLPPYILLSYIPSSLNLEKFSRLSNLTFSYELDPGLSINHQLNFFRNKFKTNSEEPVNIYEAKLCSSPVYCSVYVFTQRQDNKLKIFIISRILQTIWSLPPVAATLNNLKINMLCDEAPQNILIASRIGSFDYMYSNFDGQFKKFRTPVELFEPVNCRSLKIEFLSVDSGFIYKEYQRINILQSQFPLIEITESIKNN